MSWVADLVDLGASGQQLYDRLQDLVRRLRRGPAEYALIVFAVICFAAANVPYADFSWLPAAVRGYLAFAPGAFYAIGILDVAWVVYRLIGQAVPSPAVPAGTPSVALKGPNAFGPQDGALFRRLGRETELGRLYNHVLDEQVSVVAIMGESGAGKTSLLRAGLTSVLQDTDIRPVYWEAVPVNPVERLLAAVQQNWRPEDGPPPADLDALLDRSAQSGRLVIVLDQFEQLRPDDALHAPVFEHLRRVARDATPPHRTTWVLAFRREFGPQWLEFQHSIDGFNPPLISLKLFSEAQAKEIVATLADAAGFALEDSLATDLVQASAGDDGVSPVDLGIGMLVLGELARRSNRDRLTADDYRFAGGAQGLLTYYVRDRLEPFGDEDASAILKMLLSLADLETNQRISLGRDITELATAARLPAATIRQWVGYLSRPDVRLLERLGGGPDGRERYRLPHERIVPSLRRLIGVHLAEAEQARMKFDSAMRAWTNADRRPKFLLSGGDLRRALVHRDTVILGGDRTRKEEFLKASVRRRRRRFAVGTAAALAVVGGGFYGTRYYQDHQHVNQLTAWGLPGDLYHHVGSLRRLEVEAPGITNTSWLMPGLRELKLESRSLATIDYLPASVTKAEIISPALKEIAFRKPLPGLTDLTLDLSNAPVDSLAGLEKLPNLTHLSLKLFNANVRSLAGLAKLDKLTDLTLDLFGSNIRSLAGLDRLRSLSHLSVNMFGQDFKLFTGWRKPPALTSLELQSVDINSFAELERFGSVPHLSLDPDTSKLKSLNGIERLTNIASLNIAGWNATSLAGLEKLPGLTTLHLDESQVALLAALNKGLPSVTSLSLTIRRPNGGLLDGLAKLPNVTDLSVSLTGTNFGMLAGLARLPHLSRLSLSVQARKVDSLAGLEKVPHLTGLSFGSWYPGTEITSVAGLKSLPDLTSLDLHGAKIESLAGLAKMPRLTTLDLGGSRIKSLTGLDNMPNLRSLDLSRLKIDGFAGLEKLGKLAELTVTVDSAGFGSLSGLKTLARLKKLAVTGFRGNSLVGLPAAVTDLSMSSK